MPNPESQSGLESLESAATHVPSRSPEQVAFDAAAAQAAWDIKQGVRDVDSGTTAKVSVASGSESNSWRSEVNNGIGASALLAASAALYLVYKRIMGVSSEKAFVVQPATETESGLHPIPMSAPATATAAARGVPERAA